MVAGVKGRAQQHGAYQQLAQVSLGPLMNPMCLATASRNTLAKHSADEDELCAGQ